ncbi:hypothetical protein [Chitinimonas lacunae]|uniref:Uncharacterized protein n=1 Tax=Chitinimonas lacunae TaxID=1963018 RepID=A0ABV8MUI2_9NEIS
MSSYTTCADYGEHHEIRLRSVPLPDPHITPAELRQDLVDLRDWLKEPLQGADQ